MPGFYYFAYGSNMEIDKFQKDFPGAKAKTLVYLNDYALRFDKWSETNESTVADVAPFADSKVFGIIYEFPEKHLSKLDKKEGGYRKEKGYGIDSKGNMYEMFFYTVKKKSDHALLPKPEYVKYMVTGLRDGFRLDNFKGTPHHKALIKYAHWLNEIYTLSKEKYSVKEDLGKWFGKGKWGGKGGGGWDRYSTTGKRMGKCGDAEEGDPYSACLSSAAAEKLGKKGIANFVKRKRAAQKKGGDAKKGGEKTDGDAPIRVSWDPKGKKSFNPPN